MFKSIAARVAKAFAAVIHDPTVDRAGVSLAILVGIRILIALGFSVELATQVANSIFGG